MSSFEQGPQDGNGSKPGGPILMMPPPLHKPTRWQLWRGRIFLVIFVLFCLEVGIILTVLPWTRIWTENSLLMGFPQIRELLMYDFVRGLISGLGLVDIWMGVAEAVRYRESVG
jgi:hypothetical protein